jgi:hypothetical protein
MPKPAGRATLQIVHRLRQIPILTAADPPPADGEYDLLFVPNPLNQMQVLNEFGLVKSRSNHQSPPTSMASYIPGFSWRNGVGANNTPNTDAAIWPIDGVLPSDQFTIVFYIRSQGADYVDQPASRTAYHWSFDVDELGRNGLSLVRVPSSPGTMSLRWNFESLRLEARLGLLRGDIPADTWKRIVCTWDGVVLRVATGDNARNGASDPITTVVGTHSGGSLNDNVALPLSCCLLDGVSGGLFVNGGGPVPANTGGPFDLEGPYIYRYQRSFSSAAVVKGRAIAVDPSMEQGVFPADVGGVLNQYSGMVQQGNASRDLDAPGRDAVIAKASRDGLKTIRFPDLTAFLRFTYTPDGPKNGVSAYDWTDFDSRVTMWTSSGIVRFHADLLGTPLPLRPGAFPFRPVTGIGVRSTTVGAPSSTTRMSKGTLLFISEGSVGEIVHLTSDFPGGAGNMSVSATANAYSTAAVVDIGQPIGRTSGNVGLAPAIDNSAWGQISADVVDRLINVHHVTVVHLGFWNEPRSTNLYCGTKAAYVAQWLAAARAINADPRIPAGVKLAAGESVEWIPTESSDSNTETGWQKAIVEEAAASGLPLPAISYHAYTGNLNLERRLIRDQLAYLGGRGFHGAKVRVGEWNLGLVAASQLDDASTAGSIHPEVWNDEYLAAFAHAFIYEAMAGGVDDMVFTRLQQMDVERAPGAEQQLHLYSRANPPKQYSVGTYFQMLWKVPPGAVKFSCDSNWPDVRAFGAKFGRSPATYTILYGRYRPWRSRSDSGVEVDLEWKQMPYRFKWKRWHVDRTSSGDGALKQAAAGDQTDFPTSVALLPLSAGCIQVVG